MDLKTCTRCLEEKHLSEFTWSEPNNRHMSLCKPCQNSYVKAYSKRMVERYDPTNTPERKFCKKCSRELPAKMFGVSKKAVDGLQYQCLECYRDQRYGLKTGQYDEILLSQYGKCAICREDCKQERALSVDHNHECCPGHKSCGNCVRGLLCQRCNAGLGQFKDNASLLRAAIAYVER